MSEPCVVPKTPVDVDNHHAFMVTVKRANLGTVDLSLIIRGEHNWLYFDHITIPVGGTVQILDGQDGNGLPSGITLEIIPREDLQNGADSDD